MKKAQLFIIIVISAVLLLGSVLYAADEFEFYIAQGIQKINDGKYKEALDLLKKALELKPNNPEAEFYTAVAYSRFGELSKAERLLRKIKKKEEFSSNVYLELGRIYYAWGYCSRAKSNLMTFKELSDDKVAKGYADSMIEGCYEKKGKEKPYRLDVSVGAQYDDNIILEASNPPVESDERDHDSRLVLLISAGARVFKKEQVSGRIDYDFYQSFHAAADRFNVHYHKVSPSLEFNLSDVITPSLGYEFEYINFGHDEYGLIHTGFLNVNYRLSGTYSIDGIYKYKFNDYRDTEEFQRNADRRGKENIFGVKYNFKRDQWIGDVHYYYNVKDAHRDYWAYTGHNVGAELGYNIVTPLLVKATADYYDRDYDDDFPGLSTVDTRHDRMQEYALYIQYMMADRLTVTLMDSYTKNDSNLREFDYDRNIVGILFTYGII
jgi:tetratricopeptide (TPR) repeat protein